MPPALLEGREAINYMDSPLLITNETVDDSVA